MNNISRFPKTTESGRHGESAAAEYLKSMGYSILHMNYRVSHLEIDIIAENSERILFVEVKSRTVNENNQSRFGRPAAAVTKAKQSRLISAAVEYLRHNKPGKRVRIDVIEVYFAQIACDCSIDFARDASSDGAKIIPPNVVRINHIENAVSAR